MTDEELLRACREIAERAIEDHRTMQNPRLWIALEPLWGLVLDHIHRRPCRDGSLEEATLAFGDALQDAVLTEDASSFAEVAARISAAHAELRSAILRVEVPALKDIA